LRIIDYFIFLACNIILLAIIEAYRVNMLLEFKFNNTFFATNYKYVAIIAFPGMLYGNAFGSSDGLKPVLIIPVLKEGFIYPF